jgi:hypothetical protein
VGDDSQNEGEGKRCKFTNYASFFEFSPGRAKELPPEYIIYSKKERGETPGSSLQGGMARPNATGARLGGRDSENLQRVWMEKT